MPIAPGLPGLKEAVGEYDFAVDGGAVSTITLRAGVLDNNLPPGAVILGGYLEVDTAVLSGTGTVAVQAEAAADLMIATAQAGLTVGRKSLIPVFTGATTVKTTVARNLKIVIATAALTAGKFRVVVFYH